VVSVSLPLHQSPARWGQQSLTIAALTARAGFKAGTVLVWSMNYWDYVTCQLSLHFMLSWFIPLNTIPSHFQRVILHFSQPVCWD
jgi:hypothetical protein